jgi:uncharacterized membrane protein
MTTDPLQLLLAVFEEEDMAGRALKALKQAKKSHNITLKAAAVVWRDEDNEMHIEETADPDGPRGALAGGALGAVIGLVGGPGTAIVGGAAGALVGGLTAEVIDSGIPDRSLQVIGQSLKPGTSAVVAIIDDEWAAQTEQILAKAGARVLTGTLQAVIAEQLQLPPTAEPPIGPDLLNQN